MTGGASEAVRWSRDRASPRRLIDGLLIAVSRVAPRAGGCRPTGQLWLLGQASKTARLQHQPASSRATATTLMVERLPRASRRDQRSSSRRAWLLPVLVMKLPRFGGQVGARLQRIGLGGSGVAPLSWTRWLCDGY